VAGELGPGKNVVVIFPDSGERYLTSVAEFDAKGVFDKEADRR